jgi:hypothetical protein
VVVVNLATNEVWEIPERPGHHVADVIAMNDEVVLVEEYSNVNNSPDVVERFLKLSLADLPSLAQGW